MGGVSFFREDSARRMSLAPLAIAAVATWLPARSAAGVDPASALRVE